MPSFWDNFSKQPNKDKMAKFLPELMRNCNQFTGKVTGVVYIDLRKAFDTVGDDQ